MAGRSSLWDSSSLRISAFAAIWGLLHILERFSAWPFVVYRAVIGVVLLVGASTDFLA